MNEVLILSEIAGIFISASAAFLGTLMLPKKMTLSADPLSHLALPGVALALIWGLNIYLGAIPFIILGIILIWFFERKTGISFEALIAIVFSTSLAVAFLFLPLEKAEVFLFGDILDINIYEAIIAVILSIIIIFIAQKIYKKLTLINISEEIAASLKMNISKYNLVYLILVGATIILGVKIVGGLLAAALVAIPASASKNLAANLKQFKILAIIFAVFGTSLGIYLAQKFLLPAGPLIIIINALIFLISMIKINNKL
jgi:ABC-type Mn2+/Zn2+ transport system permease subunit